MYNAILHVKDAEPADFASLRYIVSGGEPLPDAVAEGFHERFGVRINEGYGLTETSPVTNWCRPWEYRPHSVGPALPEVDQRILDLATGAELPPGQDGEVVMKGPNIMRGYFNRPEETAAAFNARGFFRTGDIGRLDDDRHLFITGRLKEMIIVGGENVFPREIEEVLNRHPAVADAGVIGLMDPMRGELPAAFVELKEGQKAEERELLAWCRERLAGYKCPTFVRIVEKLPRNPTGKIVRRELKRLVPTGETPGR
jgi:long-chain acyl-CoA synthetase